ncbi:AAA family ATPase (plasmid) [Burkholderia ambifaria]
MGALKILQVGYQGDRYEFESPELGQRLAIVEGPNGSGKSTFFNLIYFGLGGKVDEFESRSDNRHAEITGDTNNFVWLKIRIGLTEYSLIRKFGENLITVRALGTLGEGVDQSADTFPLFRRDADTRIFSDWILEKLGIPVVEIFQGGRNFKLNISDLMRLIYHNQAPDPHGIYKPADNSNFLSDSLEVRRAIFQVLVGKTLLALYEAMGNLKRSERELDGARAILSEYQKIVAEVLRDRGGATVQNVHFLGKRIEEIDSQLNKLVRARSERLSHPAPSQIMQSIDAERRRLGELVSSLRQRREEAEVLVRDKGRLANVVASIRDDIDRVSKVIFTHEQLKLFSSDTCPYCLNAVSRIQGHCVCGNPVDENDYQRFFYSPTEYVDIYRAKKKSLLTMLSTIDDMDAEISDTMTHQAALEEQVRQLTDRIEKSYALPQGEAADWQVEQLDEKIFELKNEQNELFQALKMEEKVEGLQRTFDSKREIWAAADRLVTQLELASKTELSGRIAGFNEIYNDFMTKVLARCRSARIDEDTYMPVINNGEYREASAEVPKRFLYYLTLLLMSLKNAMPFPRMLLIDTPETAGIDRDNLVLMLRQMKVLDEENTDYQILLSTGVDKFPPEYKECVSIRLRDDAKLLRERRQQL